MGLFRRKKPKGNHNREKTSVDMARDTVNGTGGLYNKLNSFFFARQREEINANLDELEALIAKGDAEKEAAERVIAAAKVATCVAKAKVLDVAQTGNSFGINPVVILTLEVNEPGKAPYSYQHRTIVNGVAIPRAGDIIELGKSDLIPNEFVYMGILPEI